MPVARDKGLGRPDPDPFTAAIPEIERRHALIVATARYADARLQQLRAPAADAKRLATVLRDSAKGNLEVDVLTDETHGRITRTIASFFRDRRLNDLLLLHFSCHGVKDDRGDLYLAATDTELDLLSATGVSAAWLNEQINRTRSRRTVVLLDCCFSGSFPFGLRPRSGLTVNAPDHFEGRGRAIITASSGMEYAYEGDHVQGEGQPSVFTEAVVEGLETGKADVDHDGLVSVDDLYSYVYESVKRTTPSQTPNKKSEIEGPLYLARSAYRPPLEPARLDPELLARTEDRYAGIRAGAVQELDALLASQNPSITLTARHALSRMVNDDSRQVSESARAALERDAARAVGDSAPPAAGQAATEAARSSAPAISGKPRPRWARRHPRLVVGGALLVILAAPLAVVLATSGGGAPSQYETLVKLVPASIRAPCADDEHWMIGPGQARAQTTCPGAHYDLTYGLWRTPQAARRWVANGTARDPGSLECSARTLQAMKIILPSATTGCQDKPNQSTGIGIDMWWNKNASRVAASFSWPTRDQAAALTQWQKLVTAP